MVNDIKETAKKRMDGVIDQLNTNLSSVRTGRANAMILDRVKAEYYGTLTPVNQMAAIKTPMLTRSSSSRGIKARSARSKQPS